MKLESFELLEREGYTYRAKVYERVKPKWQIWNNNTVLNTYVGNSLGWYNPNTGAKLANAKIELLLSQEMRRLYLQEMLAENNRANLKPVK